MGLSSTAVTVGLSSPHSQGATGAESSCGDSTGLRTQDGASPGLQVRQAQLVPLLVARAALSVVAGF